MDSTDDLYDYLEQYGEQHFADVPLKTQSVQQLIKDIKVGQANVNSARLFDLLTSQTKSLTADQEMQDAATGPADLAAMKSVATPKRIGDVLFLPHDAELIVVGDMHGDLASAQQIITQIQADGAIKRGVLVIFLGDYVNNGVKSWRTLTEILSFQQEYPESVILLSGNHEFKESLPTALNEYFNKHWDRFTSAELPPCLQDRLPEYDNHYGHMRLELMRSFGFAEGEKLYAASADWGMRLPYICISGDLMLSHSIGKRAGETLRLAEVLWGKAQDRENLRHLGYEAWHAQKPSLHSAFVNNRTITPELLTDFGDLLGVNQFVVGHCHYRSADTLNLGDRRITTVVSSSPYSPDSGHYMYQQMVIQRDRMRVAEELPAGDATASYLHFSRPKGGERSLNVISLNFFPANFSKR